MQRALDEMTRRRELQQRYNLEHEITPRSIVKSMEEVRLSTHVADARTERADGIEEAIGDGPDDGSFVDWFRDGHAALVAALESAPPDLECWSFLAAPSPLAFWARRQCHETGIHRVDAQGALGPISPIPPAVAADGIDELLTGFITRRGGRLKSDEPRTLGVHTVDTNDDWLVRIADRVQTSRGHDDADCIISGHASDLHLLLWNRRSLDGIHVTGDRALLDQWRDSVTIRWS
jgi:uncharacterized protein (TIGR03083 family)